MNTYRSVRLRPVGRGFLLIAALTSLLPVLAAAEVPLELTPGVLLSPERDSLFLMLPEGGISEVEMSTGRERWRTTRAAKPLLVYEGRLLAQADGRSGKLELRSFDLADQGAAPVHIVYELPGDVTAAVDDELLLAFSARAVVHDGQPHVIWSYKRNSSRLQPGYARDVKTNARGALRVDVAQRTAVSVDYDSVQASAHGLPAPLTGVEGLVSPTRAAGDVLAGLELAGKPGQTRRAVLKRWNAGDRRPLSDVALETSDVRRWVFSADNRHVLLGSLQRKAVAEERYAWTLYSVESGERLVQIARPQSGAAHVATDSTLLYMTSPMRKREGERMVELPMSVEAVGFTDGAVTWSRPVRDTAYRGPYPKELPRQEGPTTQTRTSGALRK